MTQSEAIPGREYVLENEEDADSPDVFFLSEAVEEIPPRPIPVHSISPCPKRALKPPTTTLTGVLGSTNDTLPQRASQEGALSERALEKASRAWTLRSFKLTLEPALHLDAPWYVGFSAALNRISDVGFP